jgi:AraC family transcriptional regulator, exoenzyme S synthesis regulatory protein ExsA
MKASKNDAIIKDKTNVLKPEAAITIRSGEQGIASEGSLFLEENLLFFVQEGRFSFRYGEVTYPLGKHQFAHFKKDILLEYRCEDQDSVFIVFVLKTELVLEFTKLTQLGTIGRERPEMVTLGKPGDGVQMYIESLKPYFQKEGGITDCLAKIKLLELLFCLDANDQSILEQVLDVREHYRPNITSVVEENTMNSLSLRQLARLAGRSVSSFRRDFLSIYNMPPSRWIRLKRLGKAQELLVSTNMTVTNICYTLGFESIAHFSRIFKSHFGYPPSELRMNTMVA